MLYYSKDRAELYLPSPFGIADAHQPAIRRHDISDCISPQPTFPLLKPLHSFPRSVDKTRRDLVVIK